MANPCSATGSSITQEEWDEALAIAKRWKNEREAFFGPNKTLGILSRALLHLKVCYDEKVACE